MKCREHTCLTLETPIIAFLNVHPGCSALSEGGGAVCRPVTLGSSSTAQHLVNSWCRDYGYCQAFSAPGVGGGGGGGVGPEHTGVYQSLEEFLKSLSVGLIIYKAARTDGRVLELCCITRISQLKAEVHRFFVFFTSISMKISICCGLRPESTRRKSHFERRTLLCSIYPQRLQ